MGRLDDAAKRKVVELREAGLSFRKIKAVLELENIKVSAQAIYLFLKEFQGRSRQNDLSVSGNSGLTAVVSASREMALSEAKQGAWKEQQLRNLLREASSHAAGFTSSPDTSGQSGVTSSGTGATSQERRQDDKKDEDVRIVSVTSLAQSAHHDSIQTARSGAIAGSTFARRRYTPSPANPVLVARKRLLDKALFHRARVRDSCPQSGQQTVSLLRRDQSSFLFSEGRKVMLPQTTSCSPTTTTTTTRPPHLRGQHPGSNLVRQGFQQRANLYSRSADQPHRGVGIRLPAPGQSGTGAQAAGSTIRPRAPAGQPSPPCQQSCVDTGTLSSLQEHVKALASDVRSISLALRMMVEQQGRLEREQSQQTQVQKQILSTLQKLASHMEPSALQLCTTSTATSCPMSSASYNQSALVASQGSALCSQAQSRYGDINGAALDSIGPFSLDSLSSGAVNTFQPSESLQFSHIHPPAFTQSHTQPYTPEMLSYAQPQADTCPGMDSKPVEMSSPNSTSSFQSCRSQGPCSAEPAPVSDAQLTIVKVESI